MPAARVFITAAKRWGDTRGKEEEEEDDEGDEGDEGDGKGDLYACMCISDVPLPPRTPYLDS